MTQNKLNRDWVKTAAIIFLSILLILTFFSNTILNKSLPEVSTAAVESGSITAKVKGTGTVSAIGNTKVTADNTYTVASIKVKEGTEVEAGDPLIVMGAASEELETAQDNLDSLRFKLMSTNAGYPGSVPSASYEYAQAQRIAAEEEYNALIAKSPISDEKLKEKRQVLANAQSIYDSTNSTTQYEVTSAYNTMSQYNPENPDQKTAYENAAKHYAEVVENRDRLLAEAQYAIDVAQAEYDDCLAETQSELEDEINDAYEELMRLTAAEKQAYETYMASVESNNRSAATTYYSALEIENQIEKAEAKVEKLSGGEDNAVKAPVAGTITSISVSPGDKVTKGDVMMLIEVPDLGYTMSYSVTNDQAKRIKVGDTATVSNYYWGSDITATVSSIKVDPKNPKTNKLIVFTLEGDLNTGSELTVSVGEKSANYDIIVPNSAVRNDSNGNFVLIINAKNNALGNRYFAKRVSVEVLASDDNNSAVSGDLSNGDFVITTSSEPIKNGDQVRMSDNG